MSLAAATARGGPLTLALSHAFACRLRRYARIPIESLRVRGPFIAYCSPESTFAVTKQRFDAARRSIRIGIYDFTASWMEQLVVDALSRGVAVSLLLDLAGAPETTVFQRLLRKGVVGAPAPSCTGAAHYFTNFHEKVIVIDDEWTLVQSGNYSHAGIPENVTDGGAVRDFQPGNRDMGVAVRSRPLASFFAERFRADLGLARAPRARTAVRAAALAGAPLLAAAPRVPRARFRSRLLRPPRPVTVRPVLTPDNFLEVVPPWLAGARQSIHIEMQYIRARQPKVRRLLAAIASARAAHPRLDVRVILAAPLMPDDLATERRELRTLAHEYGLALGTQVRILNPRYFVHCHNKLVILDRHDVLVGSQNWSDTAISSNRESSLLVAYPALAHHFERIFASDWATALRALPKPRAAVTAPHATLRHIRTVTLDPGDFEQV